MESLALGLALGLGAGISPGPLLALVLTTALRSGTRAGLAVAAAPLVTDVPVVAVSLLAVGALPARLLAVAAVAGGLFVVWLGVAAVRDALREPHEPAPSTAGPADPGPPPARRVLAQAAAINLASPHPWVFWLTVGAPLLVSTWRSSPPSAVAFVAGFYACLVGAKLVLATVVGTTRHRLPAGWLRRALVAAGVLLAAAGVALVAEFAAAALG